MNAKVSEFQLFQPVNFGVGATKELPPHFTAELEQADGHRHDRAETVGPRAGVLHPPLRRRLLPPRVVEGGPGPCVDAGPTSVQGPPAEVADERRELPRLHGLRHVHLEAGGECALGILPPRVRRQGERRSPAALVRR